MIAISDEKGSLIKTIPAVGAAGEGVFGFHKVFGFVSDEASVRRDRGRKLNGVKRAADPWLCRFQIAEASDGLRVQSLEKCDVQKVSDEAWEIQTGFGKFQVLKSAAVAVPVLSKERFIESEEEKDKTLEKGMAVAMLLALLFFIFGRGTSTEVAAPEVIEPVTVQLTPEKQKAVTVPVVNAIPQQIVQNVQQKEVRRAVAQDLGFLGMLGNNKLSKVLGGVRTQLKDASDGAGAGGKGGSGGELLVGLGQGVKRATVGNSGVAGLGGIGTKGAGGGNGGYGNSLVGSGEGKALSAMPVSQDIVLEGGLDRAVIQATIAKYISQVRACYEQGLASNPGLMGTVTMAFEVAPSGSLNYSKVAKSTLSNAQVEGCIGQKMMGWKFPKPLGGVNVKVAYPFLLRPVSS